jgi:hypothetical protein
MAPLARERSVCHMLTATVTPLSRLPTAHPGATRGIVGTSAIAQLQARTRAATQVPPPVTRGRGTA